ncbi:MAG: acyl-CoA carboxylase subunit epsilon [Demequinaceae bacterium]|nr:acyl-CoA carboxylase subunit epsilon [Demequinaceae bacterium]
MRVVRGTLDDDELAALVAGMVAMASAAEHDDDPGSPTSAWMDRSRTLRGARVGVLGRGGSAWRHSLR